MTQNRFPVTCTDCGNTRENDDLPCPRCGSVRKTVHASARAQASLTGRAAAKVHQSSEKIEFVGYMLGEDRADEILGDLDEFYLRDRVQHGEAFARRRYALTLIRLIALHSWKAIVRFALRQRA